MASDVVQSEVSMPVETPEASTWWILKNYREVVTSIIALTILSANTWMLLDLYGSVAFDGTIEAREFEDKARYQAILERQAKVFGWQKDVLLMGMGLLGAVTGYYLGRVPAERRADKADESAARAEHQAGQANQERKQAEERVREAGRDMAEIEDSIDAAIAAAEGDAEPARRSLGFAPDDAPQAAAQALSLARERIRRLRQRL